MNLVDLDHTGVQDACLHVRDLARRYGTDVASVELVGLIPGRDLDRCTDDFLQWSRLDAESTVEVRVGKGPRWWPGDPLPARCLKPSGAGEAAAGEGALAADAAAFPLGHAAPDPELLAVAQGVLEALGAHLAPPADGLGLLGGRAPLREEQVGVDSEAVGSFLPTPISGVDIELDQHLSHRLPPRSLVIGPLPVGLPGGGRAVNAADGITTASFCQPGSRGARGSFPGTPERPRPPEPGAGVEPGRDASRVG